MVSCRRVSLAEFGRERLGNGLSYPLGYDGPRSVPKLP